LIIVDTEVIESGKTQREIAKMLGFPIPKEGYLKKVKEMCEK
jgi:hypothetical protein